MVASRWLRSQSRFVVACTILALIGALVLAFWVLFNVVRPAPPRAVVMTTGEPGGAYALFAERYRAAFAQEGIELILRPSSGSIENLRVLKTDPTVDLGFIQSGIAHEPEARDLVHLGSMYFEPVWIFHRLGQPLNRLAELAGRRIAIGGVGSGTQLLALQMLADGGVALDDPGLRPLGGEEAAQALIDGRIDAVFTISGVASPTLQRLLKAPGVRLAELTHTAAYARRMPHLATVDLPAGTIDLVELSPPRDIILLGATANLIARADLHPAIVALLLQSARDIHGRAGLLQHAGEYPAFRNHDLPPSSVAQRFYESGPSFLQRYLPFWLAVLADRLLVALIPLLAILIPLMKLAPALYTWRMRARIYRWYGELKFLEEKLDQPRTRGSSSDLLAQLDRIEERANHRHVPLSYNNELYTLREHIQLVRRKLIERERTDATPVA